MVLSRLPLYPSMLCYLPDVLAAQRGQSSAPRVSVPVGVCKVIVILALSLACRCVFLIMVRGRLSRFGGAS